jgi:glycine cleavage system H protein
MVDLHAPVSGTVIEVNGALNLSPEAINQAPYEVGWLAVIEPSAWDAERSKLLGPAAYFAVMQAQVENDLKGL